MSGPASALVWHDLECGRYRADLPFWRELAAAADGPVLDVGAGAGRVALDLAGRGHQVTAVDSDPELCDALRGRAAARDLDVEVVEADARALGLPRRFALCVVPMQTVQLLGGRAGRAAFLTAAHACLRPGAVLAAALADALEGIDAEHTEPPLPDVSRVGGWLYVSQPVAVRAERDAVTIERIRTATGPDGRASASPDSITLDRVSASELLAEGEAAGFARGAPRRIPATREHVGSDVVVLRA